jgi:NAD(P)-dependent dehydrogenase (short-subunit alcohol dehydrogenase family)
MSARVAVVTGSSGGIGRAIARRLAEDGVAVAVVARRDPRYPGTVEETVAEIEAAGGRAHGFDCDLSAPDQRRALIDQVCEALGPVEILVNNAAVSIMRPLSEMAPRHVALMFEVQVHAPLELAQRALPGMRERRRGWIVNVTSRAAIHPVPEAVNVFSRRDTVYGMCKAALERFTSGLAAEVYEDNINVNAIAPVNIVPSFGAGVHLDTHRHVIEPPEVMGEAVRYLCDQSAPRITGRTLYSQSVLGEAGVPLPL